MKCLLDHQGQVFYQEHYLPTNHNFTIENISSDIVWRNDPITMFGKTYPQPRLTAWYGDDGILYTYSIIKMIATPWTPILKSIRDQLQDSLQTPFNSVLLNLYRNGLDHMSYHADNEPELGVNPTIASLSFGATRIFQLKHRYDQNIAPFKINLESHSLLVMKGELQHFWLHKINKSLKVSEPRLNLTFRQII